MNRRQDTDIFGAKMEPVAPRIRNDTFVDPNAAFNKKMENNYSVYMEKVERNQKNHFRNAITAQRMDISKVNQDADFDENYHHCRKDQDMQSSIFYPPTLSNNSRVLMSAKSQQSAFDENRNYARRETLSREVDRLPQNSHNEFRGNSSRLFGLEDRISQETQRKGAPLIPHYMKWEDYDSVRYGGNRQEKGSESKNLICGSLPKQVSLNDISESNSKLFEVARPQMKQNPQQCGNSIKTVTQGNFMKKKPEAPKNIVNNQNNQKKANQITVPKGNVDVKNNQNQDVEIKILSGWSAQFLQGLTKQCKLSNTQMVRFQQNDNGKVTLSLKRTKKWQNVTDWLRKDAKLKIRVLNN